MLDHPFSMAIDGGNDSGLIKMNPVTVRIFDIKTHKVEFRFYDMYTTTGRNLHSSDTIMSKLLDIFLSSQIPLINCVAISCDNASVNLGKHHSIMTSVKKLNPSVYFLGCPCHIVHNAASFAAASFCSITGFDVQEMMIDIFYGLTSVVNGETSWPSI
ncbi:hypothetical protein LOD99_9225 [Oopsacas minuta]|uniref:DUF4371 domain-containing protein n=1 Tax=Oopsacas minuta TaxID=111878 RepID=A0AAV7JCZ4_9METZ|nr:hypothetical protein LOD99_9225 [Oopsacas minuta]